jgi:DNA repair protein RadC
MNGKKAAYFGAREIQDYLEFALSGERIEKFLAVYLDSGGFVITVETLFEGTINQTAVYPRKAVEAAFKHGAASLIVAHNHPSGDSTPSESDRLLTQGLVFAARAVDLEVIDHIIIGKGNRFSAREAGWLENI